MISLIEKSVADALDKSRRILEAIINSIPFRVFWKDKDLIYLGCNTQFAQDAGFAKPEDIIGKDDYAMGWSEQAELYRADDLLVIESGSPKLNFDEPQTTESGEKMWLLSSKVPLNDATGEITGVLGTYLDITDRKHIEEKIKMFSSAVESAYDGIIITDMNGNITYANTSAIHIYGYQLEELMKLSVVSLSADPNLAKEMTSEVFSSGKWSGEIKSVKKNNEEFLILLSISVIKDEKGIPISMMGVFRDITEQKRVEVVLRESEGKYRNLFNNLEVGMFRTRLDGSEILEFNEKYLKILNYTIEEIKGKPSINIWANIQERERMVQLLKTKGQVTNLECELLTKQGNVINCITSLRLYPDTGILEGSILDITERKLAEEKLKSINERFELAIDAAAITVWEHDFLTDIIKIDDNFNRIYGNAQGNYQIGFNEFIKFVHPDDVDIIKINLEEAIKSDENARFEFRIIRPDGDIRNIEAYGKILKDTTNKPVKFIGVNLDISEFKKAEQELITAKEHAEESDRLKSAFLANMSHEIRTPMNGILGFAGLLKEPKLKSKERQDYISIIEKSGARMLNIINDIMSISKVESGQMNVNISETNVNVQIEYLYTFFRPEAEQKGLRIFFTNALPTKEAILETDREKVFAILTNLIKNALKFTKEGL